MAALAASLLAASCGTAGEPAVTNSETRGPAVESNAGSVAHDVGASVIDGLFDVGGHRLYLQCTGTGTPTVVYMHGSIDDDHIVPHVNAEGIQERLKDDYRVCAYDRRNVGDSDTVDAPQSPDEAMSDMRQLLASAGVEPPYVLLGASFGGLLSYLYANTHPDEVAGMVLLDSGFPDELALDRYFPDDETYKALSKEDSCCTPERISHYEVLRAAQSFIGDEPDIPVVYFASEKAPWDLGVPAYDRVIRTVQADFVKRFPRGELRWVDSPHFMEPEIPDEIAAALREVAEGTT